MPETLAERISKKYGNRQIVTDAIREFAGEVAAQIEAEATDYMGQGRRGLLRGRQILLRAAGGEG